MRHLEVECVGWRPSARSLRRLIGDHLFPESWAPSVAGKKTGGFRKTRPSPGRLACRATAVDGRPKVRPAGAACLAVAEGGQD